MRSPAKHDFTRWGVALKPRLLLAVAFATLGAMSSALAQEAVVAPPGSDWPYDVRHLVMNLTVDLEDKKVEGSITHVLTPTRPGQETLELDCGAAVTVNGVVETTRPDQPALKFQHDQNAQRLRIDLGRVVEPGDSLAVRIDYVARPNRKGLFFIEPTAKNPDLPRMVWSQGQPQDNRQWLPSHDFPNDLATTEMIVTVKQPNFALSNGILTQTVANPDGTTTYHWLMRQPHVGYLITLVVGEFNVFADRHGNLPVDYYVLKTVDEATTRAVLGRTPAMIAYFERMLGVTFPYDKYAQVCLPEFTMLGMENASATSLADSILVDPIARLEKDSDDLIAHELAHQWFGDLLTCADWTHLWLNEGFATYAEALWAEEVSGDDGLRLTMEEKLTEYALIERFNSRPQLAQQYNDPMEVFDHVAYNKGGLTLHMMRGLIGDAAWWQAVRNHVRRHQFRNVVTADLQAAFEEASDQKLDWFFEQWTLKRGHPTLRTSYDYDPERGVVRLRVQQTQRISDEVPVFRIPTTVAISYGLDRVETLPIVIDQADQEFVLTARSEPLNVEIDPLDWVLKQNNESKPDAAWLFQLRHARSVTARLRAAAKVARMNDEPAQTALATALARESHPNARAKIISLLNVRLPTHRAALIQAANDPNAIVRREALTELTRAPLDPVTEALCRAAWSNPHEAYGVRKTALRALARANVNDLKTLLNQGLKTPSQNDTIAIESFNLLLRQLDDPGRLALIRSIAKAESGCTRELKQAAINAFMGIARNQPQQVDELTAWLADPDPAVRLSVLNALAELKVKSALPALRQRREVEPWEELRDRIDFVERVLQGKAEAQANENEDQNHNDEDDDDPAERADNTSPLLLFETDTGAR